MTLIEVVAAIALLGTLLAMLVMARAAIGRQQAVTARQMQAVDLVDALVSQWWEADAVPLASQGLLTEKLAWQTQTITTPDLDELDIDLVRLTVVNAVAEEPEVKPLFSLDLLVPRQPEENKESGAEQTEAPQEQDS